MADISGAPSWTPQNCNQVKSKPRKTWFKSRESGNTVAARSQRRKCVIENSKRPSYLRLDSTGEHSASSSEELNGGFSPEIHAPGVSRCPPRFQPQGKGQGRSNSTEQGGGLFDKVRAVFGNDGRNQYLPPNQRYAARNLTQRNPIPNSPDDKLANLDSMAEKFTSMNMSSNINPKPNNQHGRWAWGKMSPAWQPHGGGFRDAPENSTQEHWGGARNVHHQPTMFHPYPGMNQLSPLLSSTQNYHRNFYPPPWQQMMGGKPQRCPPFQRGFNNLAHPWQKQHPQHPLFPWQHCVGPQMMMQGRNQPQRSMAQPQQQRGHSPGKKQRWHFHGSQKRPFHQPKAKQDGHSHTKKPSPSQSSQDEQVLKVTESVQPEDVTEVKYENEISKERTIEMEFDAMQDHKVNSDSAIYSGEEVIKINDEEESASTRNENIEIQTAREPKVSKVFERHSSIDLILSNYDEVQLGTEREETALLASSDSEDSYAESDSDSAVETNADLWESFTATDDPYNPLCGWRCTDATRLVHLGVTSSERDYHVDSGTDEGDNWSETDSDDDYDSGDDLPNDDDVDSNLPRSFHLSDPQLKNLHESLSSTPKEKSNNASPHHPSVAFILGSTSSSSEDDSDDDWDTVDDSATLQDDPLWDSFNRPRDPYSPMEAWKCHASNLSSSITTSSPPQTPITKRDSVEGIRTLLLRVSPTEQEKPQSCSIPRKDSEGESFAIATVRIYAAKDDIDVGSPSPSGATMKRVVSASCLRRVQLTPQDKAAKKVRFCPNSSFIVLVEKDSPSCETDPSPAAVNDWQACARDRMRFKARIDQLSQIIDPVLTKAHRERVYESRMNSEGFR